MLENFRISDMTKNDAPTESTTVQADTNIPTTSSSSKEPKGVRTTKGCLLVALCSALLVLSVGAAAIFLSIQPLHFDDSSTENSNAHLVYSAAPVNETITVLPTDEDVEFALAPSSSIPEQTTQRYTTLPGLIRAPQNTVYDAATVYSQQIIVEENKVPLCEIPFDQDPENCLNE